METSTAKKPKTMAELLPNLSGILSKDAIQTLTAKKQSRATMAQPRNTEVIKPLTIEEMRADIKALRIESPRRFAQGTSNKKKIWNSSVKIDKKISHTADGSMRNNPVRKVLQFQPKNKFVPPNPRMTMRPLNAETPKFPKPEFQVKKQLQARNIVRISGICNISETPVINKKPAIKRMTVANKENNSNLIVNKKSFLSPRPPSKTFFHKKLIPDTPLSNESWKSSCDSSFLQKEKEIDDVEAKAKIISQEQTLENLANVSPPVSTPFKEYRNVQEYFNNSTELETSALYNDNTIMCFDKPSNVKEENNREESVIVSLCDLLHKAKVTNKDNIQTKKSTELEDLLEVEKETEYNIKMIENCILTLNNMKESQIKSLHYVKKSIAEKRNLKISECELDETLVTRADTPKPVKTEMSVSENQILGKPCSVIKSPLKSPSYKIPKKSLGLRKKVFYKSMPNMVTPTKEKNSMALNMYMKLKENMNYLNTPVIKHSSAPCPDTPAVNSHNLQRQLDKLYGES